MWFIYLIYTLLKTVTGIMNFVGSNYVLYKTLNTNERKEIKINLTFTKMGICKFCLRREVDRRLRHLQHSFWRRKLNTCDPCLMFLNCGFYVWSTRFSWFRKLDGHRLFRGLVNVIRCSGSARILSKFLFEFMESVCGNQKCF